MPSKEKLIKDLEALVENALAQDYHYQRGRDYLYKGLAGVYLWWLEARKIDGFLEELYAKHSIVGRRTDGEESFTRVLRLVWRLDWADNTKAKLQQWSYALKQIDIEYRRNQAAYRVDALNKLILYITDAGGVRKLIGADKYDLQTDGNTEIKKKRKAKRSEEDEAVIAKKHLELGELHFANAQSITNIQSNKPVFVNRNGYALALIRKKRNDTYDVLATLNDDKQIEQAIVSSYRRTDKAAPHVLRLITEVIKTQSLPIALQNVRFALDETTKIKLEDGSTQKRSQSKRLLFRKKQKDILLSENRTGCSVVTIAEPKEPILNSSKDVFLNVNDRRYLEEAIIQRNELSFYTANDKQKVPVLRDGDVVASHRLIVENKVLNKKRAIYFYGLDTVGESTRPQANLIKEGRNCSLHTSLNKIWFEKVNALFVSGWLREYGERITWAKHKLMCLEFDSKKLLIHHYGERGNFSTKSQPLEFPKAVMGSPIKVNVLSKDILPVLAGLAEIDMRGDIHICVTAGVIDFAFRTELADYVVAIPTCGLNGKRNHAEFEAYLG